MAAIYFFVFYFLIVKLDLKTPGREDEDEDFVEETQEVGQPNDETDDFDTKAYYYLDALGGPENIESLDYCTTRLRMQLKDRDQANENKLKRYGSRGVMKVGKRNLQVIVGTSVEFLAEAMKKRMEQGNMTLPQEGGQTTNSESDKPHDRSLSEKDFVMPMDGKVLPLAEVPDEVFAQGMMGQGFAVDPQGDTFHSPVDGKVVQVFPTKHAIGLELDNGIEILIHIGLDTVKLNGEGFETLVEAEQMVKQGDPLIRVHMDEVREKAPSVITPIIFTNLENETVNLHKSGSVQKGESGIITVGS